MTKLEDRGPPFEPQPKAAEQVTSPLHGGALPFQPHPVPHQLQHQRKDSTSTSPLPPRPPPPPAPPVVMPQQQQSSAQIPLSFPPLAYMTLEQHTIRHRFFRTKAKVQKPCLKCEEDGYRWEAQSHRTIDCKAVEPEYREQILRDWAELEKYEPVMEVEYVDIPVKSKSPRPDPMKFLGPSPTTMEPLPPPGKKKSKSPLRPPRQRKHGVAGGGAQPTIHPSYIAMWTPSARPQGQPVDKVAPSSPTAAQPSTRTKFEPPKGPKGWKPPTDASAAKIPAAATSAVVSGGGNS
ncbi:Hypothetical predicted protein [Lecanosticta acicola]|uniref:Uncharacterized protein n=1 Tax=Lecanosticta acicola TaxID=111012 RepID=A0AAI8Z7T5_9PEZI|nr:Hypothetical predicted protein [Lecanosticta acicola]